MEATQSVLRARRAEADTPALAALAAALGELNSALEQAARTPLADIPFAPASAAKLEGELRRLLRRVAKALSALAVAGMIVQPVAAADIFAPQGNTAIYQNQPSGTTLHVNSIQNMIPPTGGSVLLEGKGTHGPDVVPDLHYVCILGEVCTVTPQDLTADPPVEEDCTPVDKCMVEGGEDPNGKSGPTLTLHAATGLNTITAAGPDAFGVVVRSVGGRGAKGRDAYVNGHARDGKDGANGGEALVDFQGNIVTVGGPGLAAFSVGGNGGKGSSAKTFGGGGGEGGAGGFGGSATALFLGGSITTTGDDAQGIIAISRGGNGGKGGGSVGIFYSAGGAGDDAGAGGEAVVQTVAGTSIDTSGKNSHGILVQSMGGGGGGSGDSYGAGYSTARDGGTGGAGGRVEVVNRSTIVTRGENAQGIFALSVGGGGGAGGDSGGTVALGSAGGPGGVGGNVRVVNEGAISTSGDSAKGIYAQSVGGGGGNGGDAGGIGALGGDGSGTTTGGKVDVTNRGRITTQGKDASGLYASSVGGGGGNGGSSTGIWSSGGLGGDGNDGDTVTVVNAGDIDAGRNGLASINSSAIFAQSIGGGGGTGGGALAANVGVAAAFGGTGGVGGKGSTVSLRLDNENPLLATGYNLITHGDHSDAVFAQSIGGGGGTGGFAMTGASGPVSFTSAKGGGGGGGDGGNVDVATKGTIETFGADSHGVFAQSIGGGGGNGGFAISAGAAEFGAALGLGGDGAAGGGAGTVTVRGFSDIRTRGANSAAIFAESIGGGGGNGGFAVTASVSGIAGLSGAIGGLGGGGGAGQAVDVGSRGLITTLGANSAGIQAQSIGGGGGNGGFAVSVGLGHLAAASLAIGGDGGDGREAGSVTVNADGGGRVAPDTGYGAGWNLVTAGQNAIGIFAQSVGGGGGSGAFAGSLAIGSSAAVSVALGGTGAAGADGADVRVTSGNATYDENILTLGARSTGILAQSIGGGGGVLLAAGIDSAKVSLGAKGGAKGDAAAVTVVTGEKVATTGAGAHGLVLQSIGGGGGLAALQTSTGKPLTPQALSVIGGGGSGAATTLTVGKPVSTTGAGAQGVVVQSLGGGGGLAVEFAGSAGGAGTGGKVQVDLRADVRADGIMLQSAGGSGGSDIGLEVASGVAVRGGMGSGAGVRLRDGAQNSLINRGAIGAMAGIEGRAIQAGGGADRVENFGELAGSIDLGGGADSLTNRTGGVINAGRTIALGQGETLLNQGRLSPGGDKPTLTTALTGNYVQTSTGTIVIDIDFRQTGTPSEGDKLIVSGSAALSGRLLVAALNKGFVVPGDHVITLVTTQAGLTHDNLAAELPVSAIATFALRYPDARTAQLGYTIDFSPAGANRNQTAVGDHFNAALSGGSSEHLRAIAEGLFDMSAGAVSTFYDSLSPDAQVELMVAAKLAATRHGDGLFSCVPPRGAAGMADGDRCAWARIDGRRLDGAANEQALGFHEQAHGASGGVEAGVGDGWRLGGAIGYETSLLKTGDLARSKGERLHAGLVVKKDTRWGELALAATAGWGRFDTTRAIPTVGVASSRQDMTFQRVTLRAARPMDLSGVMVKPSLELSYTGVRLGDFAETGAGGLNLHSSSQAASFWRLRPGLEVWADLKATERLTLRPSLKLSLSQSLSRDRTELATRFEDAPQAAGSFATSVSDDRLIREFDAGLDFVRAGGASLRLGYVAQFGNRIDQRAVRAKLVIPF